MFNPTEIVIHAFVQHLRNMYGQIYGVLEPAYPDIISFVARLSLENIADSDAAYHDGRLLRIDNVTAGRAARAILSVLPLDSFVDKPALRMQIVGKPDEVPPVQIEVQREIDAAQGGPLPMGSIERFAFYELARRSYCVIQTGERRFYGCFVFKKGVIAPDAA